MEAGTSALALRDHHDSLERDLMTLFALAKRATVACMMTVALAQAADAAVSSPAPPGIW
jgi:hypothetical protein